ncbi:hypothetical protein B7463_g4190, partial [Scytalidium lignicola]
MTTVFEANSGFSRSHSTSILPPLDLNQPAASQTEDLPRSASFNQLPIFVDPFNDKDKDKQVQLPSSAVLPSAPPADDKQPAVTTIQDGQPLDSPIKDPTEKQERVGRRKSLVIRSKSWVQRTKASPERQSPQEPGNSSPNDAPPVPAITKAGREKNKIVTGTLASLARKSWITSSRSPSPSPSKAKVNGNNGLNEESSNTAPNGASGLGSRASLGPIPQLEPLGKLSESPPNGSSKGTRLQKMKQRPQSTMMNFVAESENSSTTSLPLSSVENRSTPRTSTDKVGSLRGIEKLQQFTHTIPSRRDELYSAFRSLDNDYMKFQSKSWSLKTNVVRSSLLPFLRNYATHPSNLTLRPEDVERRVEILNKWWNGLLDLLDSRQTQTISGVDRPVILDAITGIMTRPEWRLNPALVSSVEGSPNRSPDRKELTKRKSMNSLASSGSQFLTESVFHNIRNLFIQNLLTQMCLVVDKMCLRHAPASLVIFCGKATAFAFMFVPGIADLLVRLWRLQPETIKRVADAFELPKRPNRIEDDEVISAFPVHLRGLGWTSVKMMANNLRQKAEIPILTKNTSWDGPWLSRWSGRDTDLFYVFAKHYHLLASEFISPDLAFSDKARAPGFVLVKAQLLVNLDSTIHRLPAAEPPPISFEDVLTGADATATALPLPTNNSPRLMAENRLIMLLRDFMSDRPSDTESARLTFAEAFSKVMQASAKKTSIFDHGACFTLCDFMEEALPLFIRFHNAHCTESDFVEWPFWLEVCRKMLESQNSMSEIRLFSFIFGVWNLVANDERQKEAICLDWLLTEEVFDKFFNHWCPMVRAYYMRLLCWRICRDEGETGRLDTKIFCTVLTRLNLTWAHYLYLKKTAEESHLVPPSIEPCPPAPSRRLLIIRNDTQAPASNLFLGFDGIVASSAGSTSKETAYKRHSVLAELSKLEMNDTTPKLTADSAPPSNSGKRRWTFMGKMLPSSLSSSTSDNSSGKSGSPTRTLEDARRETAIARSASKAGARSRASSTESDTPPATGTHRAFSFKFSLEWAPHMNQAQQQKKYAMLANGNPRRLHPPRLPSPAQAWVASNVPNMCNEVAPTDPKDAKRIPATARYAGRSLAEWALIVSECNNFAERRKGEGVPGLRWIENHLANEYPLPKKATSTKQRLALAIIDFLNTSLEDGTLTVDDRESIEVATSCISESFKVDPTANKEPSDQSLLQIYGVYEKLKSKTSGGASAAAEKSSPNAATSEPTEEQKKEADGLKSKGNAAMAKKNYPEAIELYTKALELIPSNPIFLSNRAAAYSASRNHESAMIDAEAAVKADPKYTKAWSRLGFARFALNDPRGSMEAYQKGIEYEGNGGSDAMKKGYETAKKRVEEMEDEDGEGGETGSRGAGGGGGGMPDLSSLASMFGGGGAGGGGGGMPDLSSIMIWRRGGGGGGGAGAGAGGGGGGMPDLSTLMQDPSIAELARNMMGGGAGRGGAGAGAGRGSQ